jgi:hypothetical protein
MRTGRPARLGRGGEDWGAEIERDVIVLNKNTRRCVRRKERKTEQREDKSPYIHRSPYPIPILKIPTNHFPFLHTALSHPIMCDHGLSIMYNLRENMANSAGE